jgi:hypothetical protein
MNKFSPLTLTLFAIYTLAAVVYMTFCVIESNARIAQIEKEFAPVKTLGPVTPAPGKRLSPVRTSPYPRH